MGTAAEGDRLPSVGAQETRMKSLVLGLLTLYQKTLSPDHGPLKGAFPHGVCRYHPTCSQYAKDAIQKYGTLKGSRLAAHRVARCHPRAAGGYDPVR